MASFDEYENAQQQYQEKTSVLEEQPLGEEENYMVPDNTRENVNNLTIAHAFKIQDSPQLSQIVYSQEDMNNKDSRSRCLFGTAKCTQRVSSTPRNIQQGTPKQNIVAYDPADANVQPTTSNEALEASKGSELRQKRRLERELFGDIDDMQCEQTYEDPIAKKVRTDEERDLEIIAKILEARLDHRDITSSCRNNSHERLQVLHEFKKKNLSRTIPKWPFLLICRSNDDRVYVRFHSDAYETKSLHEISAKPTGNSLFLERRPQIWAAASEIVMQRLSTAATIADGTPITVSAISETPGTEVLWVEKYKPRKYMELLSDEGTNRSVLHWLKMWDKIVFGKEFKIQEEALDTSKLNSFNKRTGKFDSLGGWQQRKMRQSLNTNFDQLGRPVQKVALLCGPPGIGKTTLVHIIVEHAGYEVREINASDDRSPEAFKLALENGTQMSAMLNDRSRPNCIVLDEIDGAPKQSIEFLVKFVSDSIRSKVKVNGGNIKPQTLKRPIICICNNLYAPSLRSLRQIAFVVTFPVIDAERLAERLLRIAHEEHIKTDFGALFALAEKTGKDVRSCISTMEFFNAKKRNTFNLSDVLNHSLGHKDCHQGFFDVWRTIFGINRPKRDLESRLEQATDEPQITMADTRLSSRVQDVLHVVNGCGDYERITQGVYENFLAQKMQDPDLNCVVEALQWFCFSDCLQQQINQKQNYVIYPYLQFTFAIWHLLFASLAWPKIAFPTRGYEFHQKSLTQWNNFQALRKSIRSGAVGVGQGHAMLVDTVPLVKRILSPSLRPVAIQLLSAKEQHDLHHTVAVMVDMGLKYIQVKSADAAYVFQMEPNLESLVQFPNMSTSTLTYFARQLIAREVELELVRQLTPRSDGAGWRHNNEQQKLKDVTSPKNLAPAKVVPNHLRLLQPKAVHCTTNFEKVTRDFFGRLQQKTAAVKANDDKTVSIVRSPIWYRYKEGFNNAVRKDIYLNELL